MRAQSAKRWVLRDDVDLGMEIPGFFEDTLEN